MIRSLFLLAGLAVVIAAANPVAAAEKRFGLTSFEAIEVLADVTVIVETRAPVSAVASGPQEALDRLALETRDGRLLISMRRYAGDDTRRKPLGPVTIRVNAANLRTATLVGAGSLDIDRLEAGRVSVAMRGPARLSVGRIRADRLSVVMIGNGAMTLGGGSAKQAKLTLSGAGTLQAGELLVDELASDSEGAGEHVMRAGKAANVTARGVGTIDILGRATCTVNTIGSGSVRCGERQ